MDQYLMRMHQHQIVHQCHAAIIALHTIDGGLKSDAIEGQEAVWAGIQAFLAASANISKALWGQGGRLSENRLPLRESLGVVDGDPISNTKLRNHLDHYDERLDWWFANSEQRNHIDYIIGPEGMISGAAEQDIFRWFDPTTPELNVIFWGEKYSLAAIRDSILKLLPRAEIESRKRHMTPSEPPPS